MPFYYAKPGTRKTRYLYKTKSKMVDINPTISIILNMNGIDNSIKRQRLPGWVLKRPDYMLSIKDTI